VSPLEYTTSRVPSVTHSASADNDPYSELVYTLKTNRQIKEIRKEEKETFLRQQI
jgi:hypothetical protein